MAAERDTDFHWVKGSTDWRQGHREKKYLFPPLLHQYFRKQP